MTDAKITLEPTNALKSVYVKRWRTIIFVPEALADEIIAALSQDAPATGNMDLAIEKALRWHPCNSPPSYEEARQECLALARGL